MLVNNSINSSTDVYVNTSFDTSSSGIINLQAEQQIKPYRIEALKDWSKKMNENNDKNKNILKLQENTDYEIIVDINGNKVLIRYECGATSTLVRKENTYLLSNYLRHLANKSPCIIVQKKLKNAD
ncbi:unnamed protein product [Rotaria magnacalcarata]|uniref:Uncharacterized protein n=1 Tax=Rotaria magnacalcarata TaxID=392030 RepID=A0A819H8V5_9BILA|nr:unnamed protein product [Rotaria magnacalcarata]CAF1538483.1 unnamed protein product [Rotaria magnacalcarata]CAF2128170.1 unnamed protein product [Rotaria magnacalcarata]CAF2233575.1 unnamed protein product [Rotaria magnacalcarata]CAF2238605.1 unnamed protein product [Rotaria magnacalcarata]